MDHLLRALAPISDQAWEMIDEEAGHQLKMALAARRLVDFAGPHGWDRSAINLGRSAPLDDSPAPEVGAALRRVQPMAELRADFVLSRAELADIDRGAQDADLDPLNAAARRIALAENVAVFHGFAQAGIEGITEATSQATIKLGDDFGGYLSRVAQAVDHLRSEGVGGPYGLALGPEGYTGVVETTEHGGYPVFEHLHHILQGPIVWAPGVKGAVVVSLRGGDFEFVSGQDLAIGYDRHEADNLYLYFEESFTFRVITPEAAVALN